MERISRFDLFFDRWMGHTFEVLQETSRNFLQRIRIQTNRLQYCWEIDTLKQNLTVTTLYMTF